MTILAAEAAESAGERAAGSRRVQQARARARQAAASYGSQAAYVAQRAQAVPGDRQYQPVILAEFLVAVLLVTLSPIAGVSSTPASGSGPSPYHVNDLKQLVAVGAAYFVLALVASGNRGRLAAWFGGLLVIGIAISKVPGGGLKAIFAMVGQGPAPPAQAV
jgi:hypothetical protein